MSELFFFKRFSRVPMASSLCFSFPNDKDLASPPKQIDLCITISGISLEKDIVQYPIEIVIVAPGTVYKANKVISVAFTAPSKDQHQKKPPL